MLHATIVGVLIKMVNNLVSFIFISTFGHIFISYCYLSMNCVYVHTQPTCKCVEFILFIFFC